ncbi:MAG TPA: TIR domain-containing protein, partial [Pyrinomonadaceae bacterium]|nr:TIR domain-containing protein [Pyrinomonadaceae bacterium]
MTDADAHADFTVFISYAHDDNRSDDPSCRWLERLLQQLKPLDRQGLVSVWSDKKIQTGERWHESIAAEVENADAAVLLVGPAFLGSEYIISNELPALLKNAQDRGVVVLPVIVSDCLFAEAKFKYPDPTHGPDELALSVFQSENPPDQPLDALPPHEQNKILASVARRILKLAQQPSEARSRGRKEAPKPWNVPHPRNPFFTGRAQILEDLRRTLAAEGKAALSGMGGVGKTQSAAEYAHRHRQDYAAVLWAGADTEESLKSDLAAAAVTLNLPEQGESDRDLIVAAVKRWLERNSNWLLILDNADDLSVASDFLSREWRGHLLLTTRAHATDVLRKEPVTEMTPEEGALFLLRRAKLIPRNAALEAATESDRDAAMELTREVGGLPLALDQAGAFIEKMSSTPAEYLDLYRKEGAKLRAERGGLISDHAPVTITFTLAFSQVAEASAAAARLLYFCAFLAPHAIPEEIFTDGAAEVVEEMAPLADRGIMVETIGEAGRFSLIRRNPKDRTIEIHRLVQQVIKDEMDEETQQSLAGVVVRALAASFPKAEYESWPLCEKMLPHAEEAARLVDNYGFEFLEAGVLLDRAAAYCYQRAQYAEAESLWLRVSDIGEKVLGPEDPNVAMALSNLAVLY